MNRNILAILLAAMALGIGCGAKRSVGAMNDEGDKEVVAAALRQFFTSAEKRDWKAIDALLSRDFEFYTDNSVVLSRQDFLSAMKEDNMEIQKLELKDLKVSLSDDHGMAFVKYHAELNSSIQGKPYNMVSAETVIFRKEASSWKMLHNHASIKKLT